MDMESTDCHRRATDADQSAQSCSATVKCEPVAVKEEPEWGACGVSEAAAAEGLYAGHEVKDELLVDDSNHVLQQDIFSMHNMLTIKEEDLFDSKPGNGAGTAAGFTHTCPGDGPCCKGCNEQHYKLRSCSVKLERLPVGDMRISWPFYVCSDCTLIHCLEQSRSRQRQRKRRLRRKRR